MEGRGNVFPNPYWKLPLCLIPPSTLDLNNCWVWGFFFVFSHWPFPIAVHPSSEHLAFGIHHRKTQSEPHSPPSGCFLERVYLDSSKSGIFISAPFCCRYTIWVITCFVWGEEYFNSIFMQIFMLLWFSRASHSCLCWLNLLLTKTTPCFVLSTTSSCHWGSKYLFLPLLLPLCSPNLLPQGRTCHLELDRDRALPLSCSKESTQWRERADSDLAAHWRRRLLMGRVQRFCLLGGAELLALHRS